jgi:hypothetical protein
MGIFAEKRSALCACLLVSSLLGCGASTGAGANLPLITPPVRAATPAGLVVDNAKLTPGLTSQSGIGRKLSALGADDIKSRFFTMGPTSIFSILSEVDSRIAEVNKSTRDESCLTQEPVPYQITPWGQTLTFYAQCAHSYVKDLDNSTQFFQFGQKDGITYLYIFNGAEHVAARLTPPNLATPGAIDGGIVSADSSDGGVTQLAAGSAYRVDAWIGVGYNNATSCGPKTGFDDCSYGVIELHTDSVRRGFQLSVAGVGFGYCGAQLASDGTTVFARGSIDMGTTCQPIDSLCVAASDISTPATCLGSLSSFSSPALGRQLTQGVNMSGPSQYPGGTSNQIVLNGTRTDSLAFGPDLPTGGVGVFGSAASNGGGK